MTAAFKSANIEERAHRQALWRDRVVVAIALLIFLCLSLGGTIIYLQAVDNGRLTRRVQQFTMNQASAVSLIQQELNLLKDATTPGGKIYDRGIAEQQAAIVTLLRCVNNHFDTVEGLAKADPSCRALVASLEVPPKPVTATTLPKSGTTSSVPKSSRTTVATSTTTTTTQPVKPPLGQAKKDGCKVQRVLGICINPLGA